jgi:hypothetical protein
MFIGTSAQLAAAPVNDDVTVAGVSLPVLMEIKSLGVILDSRLTFNAHAIQPYMQGDQLSYLGVASHPATTTARNRSDTSL